MWTTLQTLTSYLSTWDLGSTQEILFVAVFHLLKKQDPPRAPILSAFLYAVSWCIVSVKGLFCILVFFVLLLPHCDNWRECVCVCCVCVCGETWACLMRACTRAHTRTHTERHAHKYRLCLVGVLRPDRATKAGTLFDLESIIVHLNNSACAWTNCVGMFSVLFFCQKWILLIMHFCVLWKTAELKNKRERERETVMSNLFIVVSVLLENPVFRCTLYIQCCTLQRYTLFWYNIVHSNSSLIK